MSYAQWNPATTYVQNDIVSYLGSLFVSLQTPNLNQNPSTATAYWAVQGGGGGVSKITAGTGISITPTGGIGNVTINATGDGISQWRLVNNGGGTTTTNSTFIDYLGWYVGGPTPGPGFPSNNVVPIVVQITLSNIAVAGSFGDPYVLLNGGTTGNPFFIATQDWLYPYQSATGPKTWSYTMMVPAGNLGASITISAVSASFGADYSYKIWAFY